MLFPRYANHHPEIVAKRGVEKPGRRNIIGADRIETTCGDFFEVGLDNFRAVLVALAVGPKRSVGYATDIKLFCTDIDEFTSYAGSKVAS
jgi:hypothetical protein